MADVSLGSIQTPLPPLGSYVLFPPGFSDVVTILGATYLRTGAYVLAGDTSLAGTSWETQDGNSATGLTGLDFRGSRQLQNGNGFYVNVSGSQFVLTEIVNGIQTSLGIFSAPNGLTNYSGASWGFYIGSRRFIVGYENSNNRSSIFELTGSTLTARYDVVSGDFQTSQSACFSGNTALFITQNGSGLIRTTDGGTNWATVTVPATGLTRMDSKTGLFAVGRNSLGIIYTSTTGASGSWTTRTLPASTAVYDVMFTPSGALLALGGNGVIYRSTDDGATWSSVFTRANVAILGYDFRNSRIVAAVSENGGPLLFSTDDGLNWTTVNSMFQAFGVTAYTSSIVTRLETCGVTNQPSAQLRLIRGVVGSRSSTTSVGSASSLQHYFIRIK